MFIIQVDRKDAPPSVYHDLEFAASNDYDTARTMWRFLVDNLHAGWRISIVNDATNSVVVAAITHDKPSGDSPSGSGTGLLDRLGRKG